MTVSLFKKQMDKEKDMLRIGCHLSPSKGYLNMAKEAKRIGASTFQFFLRNPRGSKARELDIEDAKALNVFLKENAMEPILAHAPYTLNPCAKEERVEEFARMVMEDDLKRMEYFPGNFYNFHPGSHVGQGAEAGIQKTAALLNAMLKTEQHTTVLIETMAGQGTEIGKSFEEVAEILSRINLADKVGVCLDTCHVFAVGYDIAGDLEGVLTAFDKTIGLEKLKYLHVNDSLSPLGSKKDRHAPIGEGCIGTQALQRLVHHPALCHLPMVLETPQKDNDGYAREIALLRKEGEFASVL